MQLLVRLNQDRGITVVMVTHETDMAAYADRILHFVDGRLVSDTPTDGIRSLAQNSGGQ